MKQLILSLSLIVTIGMVQAQNSFQSNASYVSIDELEVSTALSILSDEPVNETADLLTDEVPFENSDLDENIEYLEEVQSSSTPNSIRKYQVMASLYDVTESHIFDGRNEPFQMAFKTDKGSILATYNWKGEVLTSEEKFRNVALPAEILKNVLKDYDGWKVVRTNYYVSYAKGKDAKKIYTVQITDGNKKKKISMDAEGAIL